MNMLWVMALTLSLPSLCFGLEDSQSNRTAQADRYLQLVSVPDMMLDIINNMTTNQPAKVRDRARRIVEKELDMSVIVDAVKGSLERHFTADEIQAMADFQSTEVGKSILKKMGAYAADVNPVVQAEAAKAVARADSADSSLQTLGSPIGDQKDPLLRTRFQEFASLKKFEMRQRADRLGYAVPVSLRAFWTAS